MLRTHHPAWRSRPSTLLLISTVAVAALALALPFIDPLAGLFGMVRLPLPLLGSVVLIVLSYVAATEWVKHRFYALPPRRKRAPAHPRRQRRRL